MQLHAPINSQSKQKSMNNFQPNSISGGKNASNFSPNVRPST